MAETGKGLPQTVSTKLGSSPNHKNVSNGLFGKVASYDGAMLNITVLLRSMWKKVIQMTKFNLDNFRFIRNCLTTEVAKLYFKSKGQACCTTLKRIQSVYKQALKVLDRKPNSHHHCYILRKHELLSWETLVQYTDACLVFKILNGLAPPPLSIFVQLKTQTYGSRSTRSAMRGDCV